MINNDEQETIPFTHNKWFWKYCKHAHVKHNLKKFFIFIKFYLLRSCLYRAPHSRLSALMNSCRCSWSWLSSNVSLIVDGKYVVLPSGELQIRNVSAEDGFKTYKCRTKHRLTGETKLSATAGRLVITGKTFKKIFRLVLKKNTIINMILWICEKI